MKANKLMSLFVSHLRQVSVPFVCIIYELPELLFNNVELLGVGVNTCPNSARYFIQTIGYCLQAIELFNLQNNIVTPSYDNA